MKMKILALIGTNIYVKGIQRNYTGEWVENVILTKNIFKAMDADNLSDKDKEEMASYIKNIEKTVLEIKEILY